jgi:hypothetical protein
MARQGSSCCYSVLENTVDELRSISRHPSVRFPASSPSRYRSLTTFRRLSALRVPRGETNKGRGYQSVIPFLFSRAVYSNVICVSSRAEWSRRSEGQNAWSYMKKRSRDRKTGYASVGTPVCVVSVNVSTPCVKNAPVSLCHCTQTTTRKFSLKCRDGMLQV